MKLACVFALMGAAGCLCVVLVVGEVASAGEGPVPLERPIVERAFAGPDVVSAEALSDRELAAVRGAGPPEELDGTVLVISIEEPFTAAIQSNDESVHSSGDAPQSLTIDRPDFDAKITQTDVLSGEHGEFPRTKVITRTDHRVRTRSFSTTRGLHFDRR